MSWNRPLCVSESAHRLLQFLNKSTQKLFICTVNSPVTNIGNFCLKTQMSPALHECCALNSSAIHKGFEKKNIFLLIKTSFSLSSLSVAKIITAVNR